MSVAGETKKVYYVLNLENRVIGLSEQGEDERLYGEIPIEVKIKEAEDLLGIKEKYIEFKNGCIIEVSKKDLMIMESVDEKIALAISEVIDMMLSNDGNDNI